MGIIMRTISLFRGAVAAVVVVAATSFATSAFASPFLPFSPPSPTPLAQAPADEMTDQGA